MGVSPPPAYVCPTCGRASWNPNDATNRYCGVCGYEDDPGRPVRPAASRAPDGGPAWEPEPPWQDHFSPPGGGEQPSEVARDQPQRDPANEDPERLPG